MSIDLNGHVHSSHSISVVGWVTTSVSKVHGNLHINPVLKDTFILFWGKRNRNTSTETSENERRKEREREMNDRGRE